MARALTPEEYFKLKNLSMFKPAVTNNANVFKPPTAATQPIQAINQPMNNAAITAGKVADSAVKEYDRLASVTGDKSIIPQQAPKTVDLNNTKYNLNDDDYNTYANQKDVLTYKLVDSLIKTDSYKNMDEQQRANEIKKAFSNADDYAKNYIKPSVFNNNTDYTHSISTPNKSLELKKDNVIIWVILIKNKNIAKKSTKPLN